MASPRRPPGSSSGRSTGSSPTPDGSGETPPSWDLERFVVAQAGVHDQALAEVRSGRKTSHWMWFVYPQLRDLGRSEVSRFYGLASLDEARAYLGHAVLGERLRAAAAAALAAPPQRSAEDVFGGIDAMKLRSSMTLFARVAPDEPVFRAVLRRYFDGLEDGATLALLDASGPGA
ncbi:MAG TPA: DUF1810 domain-containing protein [Candidatus Limnocylindrales bacterium]|nr:DUF1810 domain-containing protein [Candidatus Limnocylindrales bacterium]